MSLLKYYTNERICELGKVKLFFKYWHIRMAVWFTSLQKKHTLKKQHKKN